jgi:5-methylcytosine-specific restriction enzyme A
VHQFEVGQSYYRESVLLFLGSKQPVSGIVYGGLNADYLAVFTGGRFGKRANYVDGWRDGAFQYCGQGSKGDQKLVGANARLAGHKGTVLVFETWKPRNSWKGMQRFTGEFRLAGREDIVATGARKGDHLIIFVLAPLPTSQQPQLSIHVDPRENMTSTATR